MMLVKTILLAAVLSAAGLATDIDDGDIPYQCRDVCNSFIKLTKDCDAASYGPNDDANELACICNAENSRTQLPICEACVTQYDKKGADNDVNKLVRKCNFAYTSYNTAMPPPVSTTAPGSGPPASPLKPATSGAPAYSSGTAPSAAPAPTGAYGNGTSPTTMTTAPGGPAPPLSVPSSSATGKPAEQSGNAAAVNGVAVGMMGTMGVLGWFIGAMQLY